MYKIMIVEDDSVIAGVLNQHLRKWGLWPFCVEDFAAVTEIFVKEQPQLVLMDIGLPYYNGYYWCSEIRKVSNVPIVFLSSNTDNMDIVMAMNMGGDDFITKPFDLQVVTAKLQAILRRTYSFKEQTNVIENQGMVLNLGEGALYHGGRKIDLTKNELRILQLLMEHAGTVVRREELMERLWDNECFIDDNTLTVNVTRLRRKLEEAGLRSVIHTKKGLGYLIEKG